MSTPTSNEDALALLQKALPDADIDVQGDGYKYQATVIDELFEGMSLVQRHKRVYAALESVIADGSLHALSITAKTPAEAQKTDQ